MFCCAMLSLKTAVCQCTVCEMCYVAYVRLVLCVRVSDAGLCMHIIELSLGMCVVGPNCLMWIGMLSVTGASGPGCTSSSDACCCIVLLSQCSLVQCLEQRHVLR